MTTQVLITTFDRIQVDFILRNHEKFSKDEVAVAAKRLVELDRLVAWQNKIAGQIRALERENAASRFRHEMHGVMCYEEGRNDGFLKALFGIAL